MSCIIYIYLFPREYGICGPLIIYGDTTRRLDDIRYYEIVYDLVQQPIIFVILYWLFRDGT